MATTDQLKEALKRAAQARDMEAVDVLSKELEKSLVAEMEPNAAQYFGRGLIKGASTPADLIKSGSEALGLSKPSTYEQQPSETAIRGLNKLSQEALGFDIASPFKPSDMSGRVAESIGDVIGSAPYALGAMGGLSKLPKIGKYFGNVLSGIGEAPKTAAALEVLSGAGMGFGRDIGAREGGETGELIGGIAGAVSAPGLASTAIKGGNKAFNLFRKISPGALVAEKVAESSSAIADKLPGALGDSVQKIAEWGKGRGVARSTPRIQKQLSKIGLENIDLSNVDESISGLSWTDMLDNHGIRELEASLANPERFPELAAKRTKRLEDAKKNLESMLSVDTGGAEMVKRSMQQRIGELKDISRGKVLAKKQDLNKFKDQIEMSLQTEAFDATKRAEEAIERLSPSMRESEASKVLNQELMNSYETAKNLENLIWKEVSKKKPVKMDNIRKSLNNYISKLTIPEQEMISKMEDLGSLINGKGRWVKKNVKIDDILSQRSLFGEELVKSMREGSMRKANIIGNVRDILLDGAKGSDKAIDEAIDSALAYSFELRKTFHDGPVGKIIGFGREGARPDPRTTLKEIVRIGGIPGQMGIESIQKASGTDNSMKAARDYLLGQFSRSAISGGKIKPEAAKRFLTNNADILDNFPDIKADIKWGIQSGADAQQLNKRLNDTLSWTQGTRKNQRPGMPEEAKEFLGKSEELRKVESQAQRAEKAIQSPDSSIARFLNAPDEKEISNILKSQKPVETAKRLKNFAIKSPEVDQALKNSVIEHINMSASGENGINPKKLSKIVFGSLKQRGAFKEMLGPKEFNRLEKIAREFELIEKSIRTKSRTAPVEDVIGYASALPSKIIGAKVGSSISKQMGGAGAIQIPGMISNLFGKIFNSINLDSSTKLLQEAIENPQMFKDLMMARSNAPIADKIRAVQRIDSWIMSTTREAVAPEEENQ